MESNGGLHHRQRTAHLSLFVLLDLFSHLKAQLDQAPSRFSRPIHLNWVGRFHFSMTI